MGGRQQWIRGGCAPGACTHPLPPLCLTTHPSSPQLGLPPLWGRLHQLPSESVFSQCVVGKCSATVQGGVQSVIIVVYHFQQDTITTCPVVHGIIYYQLNVCQLYSLRVSAEYDWLCGPFNKAFFFFPMLILYSPSLNWILHCTLILLLTARDKDNFSYTCLFLFMFSVVMNRYVCIIWIFCLQLLQYISLTHLS